MVDNDRSLNDEPAQCRHRQGAGRICLGKSAAAFGIAVTDCLFDGFAGLAGALLDPSDHFVLFAFGVLEIVVGEIRPLLGELAFDDVPVAFDL
jgi:hypothetical protein